MRADVKEKILPLSLRREMDVAICIQSDLRSREALGSRRVLESDQGSRWFLVDGFMTRWWINAFGSGSYASKPGGFNTPTMVLFETRSLQLCWVIRGGIG